MRKKKKMNDSSNSKNRLYYICGICLVIIGITLIISGGYFGLIGSSIGATLQLLEYGLMTIGFLLIILGVE